MNHTDSSTRPLARRLSARLALAVGASLLIVALSGCTGASAPSHPVELPKGFPSLIDIPAESVVQAESVSDSAWRVVFDVDDEAAQTKTLDALLAKGFAVIGQSGEGANRVYSLAGAKFLVRLSFPESDGGRHAVELGVSKVVPIVPMDAP